MPNDRPPIVVLCGSTRFRGEFELVNQNLTLAGEIVLSCGVWDQVWLPATSRRSLTESEKSALDALHKRKIDLADYVFVIDVGCYVGESTRSEIRYAESLGKRIVFWSERSTGAESLAVDHPQR